jgi:hypothetical protein
MQPRPRVAAEAGPIGPRHTPLSAPSEIRSNKDVEILWGDDDTGFATWRAGRDIGKREEC